MKILITRQFAKWARKQRLPRSFIYEAALEVIDGIIDASLGQHLYKKRISINNSGKRGGARTILFYVENDKIIFFHGFKKNEKENLSNEEFKGFKMLSQIFVGMTATQYEIAVEKGDLKEL